MKVREFRKLIREEVRKVLKESAPKSGSTISDNDLIDQGYLGDYENDWLELFTDEYDDPMSSTSVKRRFIKKANDFLSRNGLSWKVKDIVDQDEDEGEITWRIA